MGIDDFLKTVPKSEIIEFILEHFKERTGENELSHLESFPVEINLLDRIIAQFFFLSFVIRESTENDKYPGRFFFSIHYINTIANNFFIIRELFVKGLHIQCQLMIRTQFEFINNLIAFVGDDDFFMRFGMENGQNNSLITPKPIHAEKSIKKLLKQYNSSNDFDNIWKSFKEIMNFMYTDLSESAHGNILRIALQSLSEDDNNHSDDILTQNICGVKKPLTVTVSILRQSINYFQLTSRLVWIQIESKGMIDETSPFLDFVDYYKDKFNILSDEK